MPILNKQLSWFLKHKDAFNISYVAKSSGIPHASLDKWGKGLRPLSEKSQELLKHWVKEFKK